jgi:uncharacterized protein YecE (DUF72 family)
MIYIGLAGWGDHNLGESGRGKLTTYTGHFPFVELDSSFYALCGRYRVEIKNFFR